MDAPKEPVPVTPPESPPPESTPHTTGVEIRGGEVRVGRDIVGGDEITITQQGFSPADVRKLVITVAIIVAATAAIFFVLGTTVSVIALAALQRPIPGGSSLEAAQSMQNKIDNFKELPPGQPFVVAVSEKEISSYFQYIAGPQLGVSDGKVRFLDDPGSLVVGGNLKQFGNLPFAATFQLTTGSEPFVLDQAWVRVLPTSGTTFGWIPVTPLLRPFTKQLNDQLAGAVTFTSVQGLQNSVLAPTGRVWAIQGTAQ